MSPRLVVGICLCYMVMLIGYDATVSNGRTARSSQARSADSEFLSTLKNPQRSAAVCIVDSGVTEVSDLKNRLLYRESLTLESPDDADFEGHGTYVASVIASADDGVGITGVAPQVNLVSIGVAQEESSSPEIAIAKGVERCLSSSIRKRFNVKVINVSSSSRVELPQLRNLVRRAERLDVNFVSIAGNEGSSSGVDYPARYRSVFAVGASRPGSNKLCGFSNYGKGLDISAQGCQVDGYSLRKSFVDLNGSSFAAPVVSAVLAALRSYRPDLTAKQAEKILVDSADRGKVSPIINAKAAFKLAGLIK